jgi:hypothetical protein
MNLMDRDASFTVIETFSLLSIFALNKKYAVT